MSDKYQDLMVKIEKSQEISEKVKAMLINVTHYTRLFNDELHDIHMLSYTMTDDECDRVCDVLVEISAYSDFNSKKLFL